MTAIVLVVSVLSVTTVAAGSQSSVDDDNLTFGPDVPETDSFSAPESDGIATVDGKTYDSVQRTVEKADPRSTVHLEGRFDETVVITTSNLTLSGSGSDSALIHGDSQGDVLAIEAPGVTIRDHWNRNSGYSTAENDAAISVNASFAVRSMMWSRYRSRSRIRKQRPRQQKTPKPRDSNHHRTIQAPR